MPESTIYNFDMARFYTKRLRDIRDAQRFAPRRSDSGEEGIIPFVVPTPAWRYDGGAPFYFGLWSPDPSWDSEYFLTN